MNNGEIKQANASHRKLLATIFSLIALQCASIYMKPSEVRHSIFSQLLVISLVDFICAIPASMSKIHQENPFSDSKNIRKAISFSAIQFGLSVINPTIELYYAPMLVSFIRIFGIPIRDLYRLQLRSGSIYRNTQFLGIFQCVLTSILAFSSAVQLSSFGIVIFGIFILIITTRNSYGLQNRIYEHHSAVTTILLVTTTFFFTIFGSMSDFRSPEWTISVALTALSSNIIRMQMEDAMEESESKFIYVNTAIDVFDIFKGFVKTEAITVIQLVLLIGATIIASVRNAMVFRLRSKMEVGDYLQNDVIEQHLCKDI